jgi:hypothetical protein
VTATSAFLSLLSIDQRQKVQFSFTPQKTATAANFARTGGPGGAGGPGRGGPIKTPVLGSALRGNKTVSILLVAKVLAWGRPAVSLESSMGKQSGRTIQSVTCRSPVYDWAA